MVSLPVPSEPLDGAIVALIQDLSLVWTPIDQDKLPSTYSKALGLITKAGMSEARVQAKITMDGFPELLRLQLCVSGEYTQYDIDRAFFDSMPAHWLDADGKTRAKMRQSLSGFYETRLTDKGHLARHDIESGNSRRVIDFVLKRFPLAFRSPVKAMVLVEDCSCQLQGGRTTETAQAIANASASIGDVVVNNQVNVSPSIVVNIDGATLSPSTPVPTVRDAPVNGTCNADSTTPPADKTGQSEGNGRKLKPKSRRKRTDPKADKMLSEAWDTGQYKTHVDLAIAKGTTAREVKLAIDRHRKRQAVKGLPRKKPRQ